MAVDAKLIKELRDKTGMGITDCKKALEEANGSLEEAETLLRKRQKEKAIKKADRPTGEGVIALRVSDDGGKAILIEVCCEQEPTKNNERFGAFVQEALDAGLHTGAANAEMLLSSNTANGSLQDALTTLAGTVGENVQLKRAALIEAPANGVVGHYLHFNQKAGAMCALALEGGDAGHEAIQTAANDACMHAVAARPVALDRAGVPAELVEKEKEIFLDEVKDKPENIQEKILEGKLGKFYQEKCLLEQVFVKDPDGKQTVQEMVEAAGKEAGGKATIVAFVRFELGL